MCLIAYVPQGKSLSRDVFDKAGQVNPDGIGVMSINGVEKFFGNKQLKRARSYVAGLAVEGVAHAVHWRYATHGTKQLALCHPFKLPNTEAWLMHNGVIGATSLEANDDASDTLLFVNKLTNAPATHDSLEYWSKIANEIGRHNKGLVMYPDGKFVILNQDEGVTVDDIWYSNSYSLPLAMRPATSYFIPARLRPAGSWSGNQGGYYRGTPTSVPSGGTNYFPTSQPDTNFGGPFGSLIYWSTQMNSYGFWEGGHYRKLHISMGDLVSPWRPAIPPVVPTPSRTVELTADKDERHCLRCGRFKKDPPQGFLLCWCSDEALRDFHNRELAKALEKPALPSGPTLAPNDPPAQIAAPAEANSDRCEHGEDNWENCRECIEELEKDSSSEVQRWLAERAGHRGHSWQLHAKKTGEIIYLPTAKASEK